MVSRKFLDGKNALNAAVEEAIGQWLLRHPSASVNELTRVLQAEKLAAPRSFIAERRRAILRAVEMKNEAMRTSATPEDYVERMPDGGLGIGYNIPPVPAHLSGVLDADPEQLAAKRAEKAERDAERAARWAARQQEREQQWAAERAAEKATEQQVTTQEPEEVPMAQEAAAAAPEAPPVVQPPNKKRNAAARAERRQYLNDLLDADPGMDPFVCLTKLRERFGAALGVTYVYDTCRVARELHQLPTIARRIDLNGRVAGTTNPLPVFPALVNDTEVPEHEADAAQLDEIAFAATPEEDLQWLAQQARDIMRQHNLLQLVLTLDEKTADWETKVAPRMVRGTMKF